MTDTNSTPTPPGDSASGGHTPASQQPVPLQPTQPAPYSAQGAQPYGGQQAYTGQAGQATGYGAQQPYGYGAQQAPGSAQHSAGQVYGQQTYEAEPVSMHAQHAAPKGNGGKTFLIAFAGALVACVLAFGVWGIAGAMIPGGSSSGTSSVVTDPSTGETTVIAPSEDPTLAEAVSAKCLPSVAAITVYADASQNDAMSQYFGYQYGGQSEGSGELVAYSQGSGVVLTEDGYIITNNHVVDGAQSVSVQLSDGTSLDAEIIGTDEQTDLAVIKVTPTSDLTAAEFGDSDELEPGEYAYAIGSPGGVQFANTITGGRISAINRDLTVNDRVMTLIQTDASINNGNSGGALINKYGQVVGITSAKLSGNAFGSATVEGMGFAIPINTAKDIVDELIQNGYVSGRPSIGITGQNVESADGKVSGVQVYSIDSRAKAASEGLQVGDVITAVDGTPTPDMDKVNELKQDKKAGDKLTLSVYRISTGKTLNITITLTDSHDLEGNDPNAQTQQSQSSQNDNSQQNDGYGSYGFSSPFGSFGW